MNWLLFDYKIFPKISQQLFAILIKFIQRWKIAIEFRWQMRLRKMIFMKFIPIYVGREELSFT